MKIKLFFALLIVVLASIFASQNPDGLDKVSEMLGFSNKGIENTALMSGYNVHFLGSSTLSTITAGLIGVLIIYFLFIIIKFVLQKNRTS